MKFKNQNGPLYFETILPSLQVLNQAMLLSDRLIANICVDVYDQIVRVSANLGEF